MNNEGRGKEKHSEGRKKERRAGMEGGVSIWKGREINKGKPDKKNKRKEERNGIREEYRDGHETKKW